MKSREEIKQVIKNFAKISDPKLMLPDLAKQALEVINEQEEEIEKLKEGLQFYVDQKHIGRDCHHYLTVMDQGQKARETLEQLNKGKTNG